MIPRPSSNLVDEMRISPEIERQLGDLPAGTRLDVVELLDRLTALVTQGDPRQDDAVSVVGQQDRSTIYELRDGALGLVFIIAPGPDGAEHTIALYASIHVQAPQ